jgi:hypothetical protein
MLPASRVTKSSTAIGFPEDPAPLLVRIDDLEARVAALEKHITGSPKDPTFPNSLESPRNFGETVSECSTSPELTNDPQTRVALNIPTDFHSPTEFPTPADEPKHSGTTHE